MTAVVGRRSMLVNVVEGCVNCGSGSFATWGVTVGRDRLHLSQCRCRDCGLVFSNPQCDVTTINDYYSHSYYEEHWADVLKDDEQSLAEAVERQRSEVRRIRKYVGGGKVLEVGSGTGAFLSAVREAGFEPCGVELSLSAVEHSRRVHRLDNITQGTLEDADFREGSFDLIYAWHVIEHVLDLNSFVLSVHRLLRPGGILWVGTETYRNAGHYLDKAAKPLRGLPPPFSTSSEHTYVFTAATLSDVLRRRGFEVLDCESYQPPLDEKLKAMQFRNVLGKAYFVGVHYLNQLFRTGPLLRLVATR